MHYAIGLYGRTTGMHYAIGLAMGPVGMPIALRPTSKAFTTRGWVVE